MLKLLLLSLTSIFAFASGSGSVGDIPDITFTWVGYLSLAIFVIGYYFVAMEEHYHIDKSKPALLMGTFIFMIVSLYYMLNGMDMHLVWAWNGLPC